MSDPREVERARAYIMGRLLAVLVGRFEVIAANGGDVWTVWGELSTAMVGLLARLQAWDPLGDTDEGCV